jgi:predicted amidohydrolase
MKIATAAYPLDWFAAWTDYEAKLTAWVEEAVAAGSDLLVFPEYGAMELVSLAGEEAAADNDASIRAVAALMEDANALHRDLARRHGIHILGASAPIPAGGKIVNRAHFHTARGETVHQDKLIMTLWERDPMGVAGNGPLKLFETALGRIAINICYDCQFPLLARAQREADLLLVPSTTEAATGFWRVRIGARARALEAQCVSVVSSTVGPYPKLELMETSHGAGGIFCPPDQGFPVNGILAEGPENVPGWTYAEVSPEAIAHVRAAGGVRNRTHWEESAADLGPLERIDLR